MIWTPLPSSVQMNHALEPADITARAASQMSTAKRIVRISWCQCGQRLPHAERDPLGVALIAERDRLLEVLPERTEAVGEGLDAVLAGLGIGEHPEQPREGDQRLVLDDVEAVGADRVGRR